MVEEDKEVDVLAEDAIQKKRNVKDILVEMKDNSELMIDLAYSALLTNSKSIAEEVEDLEELMDNLQYEIEILAMLAARTPEDAADLSGIIHVASAAEKVSDAAEDIVDVVLRGVGDHPIYQTMLDESEEQVVKLVVSGSSDLAGKTLGEYRLLSETGCFVRAIKRSGRWIYNPSKNTSVKEGDMLIVLGARESVDKLEKICCD
ncbi:MAG: potassium channel protein [Candidatus Altiarchaeales archaeon]|nr:potassium channel protein [Candidatus Altiarchaeales archaeon]MBD3416574.1 potassium channel protein [Candidatus Altiarchaeales archaeon]